MVDSKDKWYSSENISELGNERVTRKGIMLDIRASYESRDSDTQ